MNDKKLLIVGLLAVIMVLLTILQAQFSGRKKIPDTFSGPLIQGLDNKAIDRIVLGTGEDGITLQRKNKGFVVVNKDNYPATTEKINNLLADILALKADQVHTENPDYHDDLEVTEEAAQHVVKFLNEEGSLITGIIIGKKDEQGNSFVRKLSANEANSNKVYLVENAPYLQTNNAMSYIDKELFKVEKEDIKRVSVTYPDGTYRLVRNDDNDIDVQKPVPDGKQLKGTDYERVFTAVTDLDFTDVRKESDETAQLNFDKLYVCELNDSTVVTFKLATEDDKTFTKCTAVYTASTPEELNREINDPSATEEQIAERDAKFKAYKAAVEFSEKHEGWVYELASWRAGNMTKTFDDLLEDIPEPETEEPEAEQTSTDQAAEPTAPAGTPAN